MPFQYLWHLQSLLVVLFQASCSSGSLTACAIAYTFLAMLDHSVHLVCCFVCSLILSSDDLYKWLCLVTVGLSMALFNISMLKVSLVYHFVYSNPADVWFDSSSGSSSADILPNFTPTFTGSRNMQFYVAHFASNTSGKFGSVIVS